MRSKFSLFASLACAVCFNGGVALAAPTLTTLFSFNGTTTGLQPLGGVFVGPDGNVYGTTSGGGTNSGGTLFQYSPTSGVTSTLGSFSAGASTDHLPQGALVFDSAGNLYGTSYNGGSASRGSVFGYSQSTHAITTLASFTASDGMRPTGNFVADAAGNLYGTTQSGGTSNFGTIFKISAVDHSLTTLYSFASSDGHTPSGGVTLDSAGNLVGTTQSGGASNSGTVFRYSLSGGALSTLVSFSSGFPSPTGNNPQTGLVADRAGNLYGVDNSAIFRIAPDGSFSVLASFTVSGGFLSTPLVDAAGNLFFQNAAHVYELPAGSATLSLLANTTGVASSNPAGPLAADAFGNLYGATIDGGTNRSSGSLYVLTGSGFVVPEPASATLLALPATLLLRRRRSR